MSTISQYVLEEPDGTQSDARVWTGPEYQVALAAAEREGKRLIELEYEFSDSRPVADFTDLRQVDASQPTIG